MRPPQATLQQIGEHQAERGEVPSLPRFRRWYDEFKPVNWALLEELRARCPFEIRLSYDKCEPRTVWGEQPFTWIDAYHASTGQWPVKDDQGGA